MKILVFLLVLFNLLFYAFSAGYFGRPENPDAGRIEQQVTPERMHLISHGEAPPAKAVETPAPVAAEAAIDNVCLRWNNLSASETERLNGLFGEKYPDFKTTKHQASAEGNGWWVFIPPLPGKAEADKKAGELRGLGIRDYFVIQEAGDKHLAISLGVFSSEKGANDRLNDLKERGVRSARLEARPGKETPSSLEASGPATQKAALLASIKAVSTRLKGEDCP